MSWFNAFANDFRRLDTTIVHSVSTIKNDVSSIPHYVSTDFHTAETTLMRNPVVKQIINPHSAFNTTINKDLGIAKTNLIKSGKTYISWFKTAGTDITHFGTTAKKDITHFGGTVVSDFKHIGSDITGFFSEFGKWLLLIVAVIVIVIIVVLYSKMKG